MKRWVAAMALMAFFAQAQAHDPWDNADRALLVGSSAAWIVDWGQSRWIAKHPEYRETNRILGDHPSVGRVNAYFVTMLVGNYIVADALPSPLRKMWLGGTIVIEANTAARNYGIGVRMAW